MVADVRAQLLAEIAACGTDGEACAAATRCGDDPLYADFKTGCFSDDPAVFNNWDCYFDRPECKTLRDQQPAARDLLQCVSQCIGGWSPQCANFPPACSSL